ncbi:hypothetical protein BGZ51_007467 [Haplosporangium sp. Z 767]|nr:hypothetical protein BGZ51_007467 [Haplosporangium sp. Z 767]KAF9196023.1 hypothetical protein BGZ50_002531 [Haplosporangium sp. Z 11]
MSSPRPPGPSAVGDSGKMSALHGSFHNTISTDTSRLNRERVLIPSESTQGIYRGCDMGEEELEATFRALRLSSTEEALASLNINNTIGAVTSSSSSVSLHSNSDPSGSTVTPNEPNTGSNASPKRTKRVLSQLDVNELIQMKISQLESASVTEEDEEKAIAKAMRKIHKEISLVVNGQEDHLGKVNVMQRKYLEMFQDMRKQERDHLKLKKKFELLQREKDLLCREKERLQKNNDELLVERNHLMEERQRDKISMAKSSSLCRKLEDLCRQIHRENRHIKEDAQERATQISGTFEKAIVEFKDKVEHDIAEKQRIIDENDSMLRDKFNGFLEQYDVREKHFNSVVKSKGLEVQLAQAKLEQQKQISQQESAKVDLLKSQLNAFTKTEAELRKQLNVYVDKFKQVEETLNKSNSLFQTFRKEMEAMSKKGSSLEKVNLAIRAKCDTMNRNILEMAEERTKHQNALEAANKKRIKLETLCRALHAERTVLRKSLDVYEARYPGLATSAPTIASQNGGGGENGTQVDCDTPRGRNDSSVTRVFLQHAIGTTTSVPMTGAGPTLSVQNGGVKQSKLTGRRASITSGRLRQKQKQQHLQLLLQRCEQSSASPILERDNFKADDDGLDDSAHKCTCSTGTIRQIENHVSVLQGTPQGIQYAIAGPTLLPPLQSVSKVQPSKHEQNHSEGTVRQSSNATVVLANDASSSDVQDTNTASVSKGTKARKKSKRKEEGKHLKDGPGTAADTRMSMPKSSKTPPSPLSTSSLGAVSRHAQAQESYESTRIAGLQTSAID